VLSLATAFGYNRPSLTNRTRKRLSPMPADALLKTPLFGWHQAHGGRLVEFGGWSMPVQYRSIIEEHQAVRQRAGIFDISHMGRLTFTGADVLPWLEHVTTNHVARLEPGQIQYSLMVQDDGGVIDDILVYRVSGGYNVVCNASNRLKVLDQLKRYETKYPDARLADVTLKTAMLAVQGPKALQVLEPLLGIPLEPVKYYHSVTAPYLGTEVLVSRTGYTGEDGFELVLPASLATEAWTQILEAGSAVEMLPCGLGARDTLRFEAAMPLYGHEMDETVNPYAAGIGWAVKLGKGEFVGREALRKYKANPGRARVGLALEGKRIARQGCAVKCDAKSVGTVTSGTFAPTLNKSLAMALVSPASAKDGTKLVVDVRGQDEPAQVVPLPFYRRP
jgi:aminomethyltransferase